MRAKAAGAAWTRGAAGLGRVPVRPELGDDPDRRAPPVGGLREGAASGWAETRRWAARGGGAGPRGKRSGLRERENGRAAGEGKKMLGRLGVLG